MGPKDSLSLSQSDAPEPRSYCTRCMLFETVIFDINNRSCKPGKGWLRCQWCPHLGVESKWAAATAQSASSDAPGKTARAATRVPARHSSTVDEQKGPNDSRSSGSKRSHDLRRYGCGAGGALVWAWRANGRPPPPDPHRAMHRERRLELLRVPARRRELKGPNDSRSSGSKRSHDLRRYGCGAGGALVWAWRANWRPPPPNPHLALTRLRRRAREPRGCFPVHGSM